MNVSAFAIDGPAGRPRASDRRWKAVLRLLLLCGTASTALAGQHSICYQGADTALGPTLVFGCSDDSGAACQIEAYSGNGLGIATTVPGNPPGTYAVYQLYYPGSFTVRIHFNDLNTGTAFTRDCTAFTTAGGGASANAQLTGFTTDASGLVTTGVWKLAAPVAATQNRVELRVPEGFVAVGGGAMGAENPTGAYVAESFQPATLTAIDDPERRSWVASTVALGTPMRQPQPHNTTAWVIGMQITGLTRTHLVSLLRTVGVLGAPAITAHPQAQVSFTSSYQRNFVFLSGGVRGIAGPDSLELQPGQFVTQSAPIVVTGIPAWCAVTTNCWESFVNGWQVESKDHMVSRPGVVQTAMIALPPLITVAGRRFRVVGGHRVAQSAFDAHPRVDVGGLRGEFALTGIGAHVNWKVFDASGVQTAPGNLIWKLEPRPDLGGASVASKDHALPSPASIVGYAMGIKLVPVP